MIRLLVFCAATLLAGSGLAQQYKWTDKDGKVRYGDTPPAGSKATLLRPPSGPATAPASAPSSAGKKGEKALTPEQAFQKRQKEQQEGAQKADKERAEAEVGRANCESAQASLRQLQSGERISTTTSSGERSFIDDAQRAANMERAQKAVSEWCK
jgi:hypothetical protein